MPLTPFVRHLTLIQAGLLLGAASVQGQSSLLARADSAFAADDRSLARRLYEEALRAKPENSRAMFRLGQLEPSPVRALAFYERYAALEPGDAWGQMALGNQLARLGRVDAALAAYDRAQSLAPNERDGEAWDLLGREQLRAGRPRAAARSFTQAQGAGFTRGVQNRLRIARSQSAPGIEPNVGYQRDSDGNSTLRSGLSADVMIGDGTRFGGGVLRGAVRDAAESLPFTAFSLRLASRMTPQLRFSAEGGMSSFGAVSTEPAVPGPPLSPGPPATPRARPASAAWTTPGADLRLRWRSLPNGPVWELRTQHLAFGSAPLLIANHVTRSDARATLEIPLGPLRLRGNARAGVVRAIGEAANRRLDAGAALAVPLGSAGDISAHYQSVTYARASAAGYFAPRLAETIEGGTYLDLSAASPFTFSADLGAGAQRTARQGEGVGVWKPAFRAWTYSAITLAPGRALWMEIEAYDAPFAPLGVSAAPSWRYISVSSGLRWALR